MASGTYFINENSLITALLIVKKEKFNVNCVARSEVNLFKTILKDEMKNINKSVTFTTGVWKRFYDERNNIITLENPMINVNDIKEFFENSTRDIIPMIWDVEYVYNNVFCRRERILKNEKKLEDIIDKIFDNANDFYRKVANELDYDEYMYLLNNINERSCFSCDYDCEGYNVCKNWKSDALVGKMKVLK